jgi:hypothetical protein
MLSVGGLLFLGTSLVRGLFTNIFFMMSTAVNTLLLHFFVLLYGFFLGLASEIQEEQLSARFTGGFGVQICPSTG